MRLQLILLMILFILSGCAQQISDNAQLKTDWQQQLKQKTNWKLAGKMAFMEAKNRQSANLNWQTEQNLSKFSLTSFIGTNILTLTQHNKEHFEIEYDGNHYTGQSGQHLIDQLTGLNLPFVDDVNWLKGLPNSPLYEYDELYRVTQAQLIDGDGQTWFVDYNNYKKHQGFWLPYAITLRHNTLKIKLKIYTWQIT